MQKLLTFEEWIKKNSSISNTPCISLCKYGTYTSGPGDTDEAYCKKFDMSDIEFYYNNPERPHTHICEDCPYYTHKDNLELFEIYRKYVLETQFWNTVEECGGYEAYLNSKQVESDINFRQNETIIENIVAVNPVTYSDQEFFEM